MKNRMFLLIDNAPLIIFRIFLGLLLACETFGAIFTGWVKSNLIDPQFTFAHIGMEWLQPLPGNGMYYYFALMGVLGLCVMLGYRYRLTLGLFTLLWAGAYFMQKSSYNNHYYLLLLVCIVMLFLPANKYASLDVKRKPSSQSLTMPAWCSWVMIAQVTIVYFFATIAKFYPGWLQGDFVSLLLEPKFRPLITNEEVRKAFYLFITYSGMIFDLMIVPLLLYRRTRTIAFIASLIFHIFNSVTLQIGIFPFFALSFVVFFYPPEKVRKIFFRKKPPVEQKEVSYTSEFRNALPYFFIPFMVLQIILPLRHHLIKGDVLWTEEGHRLSWRMMLRSREGYTHFKIVDKKTGERIFFEPLVVLTPKQKQSMQTKPDMIWQMAQWISTYFSKQGKEVAVYADSMVSINGSSPRRLIDPAVDLVAAEWDYLWHCKWILVYDEHGNLSR